MNLPERCEENRLSRLSFNQRDHPCEIIADEGCKNNSRGNSDRYSSYHLILFATLHEKDGYYQLQDFQKHQSCDAAKQKKQQLLK